MRRTSNVEKIRVVHVGNEVDEIYVGYAHIPISIMSRRANISLVRKIISLAYYQKVRTLILPPYVFNGPLVDFLSYNKRRKISKLAVSLTSRYYQELLRYGFEKRMPIIISAYYEKAGPRIYVASVGINIYSETKYRYRKINISRKEQSYGIAKGKNDKITVFTLNGVGYAPILFEDIYKPDIARIYSFLGAHIFIVPTNILGDNWRSMVEYAYIRARENRVYTIICGAAYTYREEVVGSAPTIIVDRDGGIVYRHENSLEPTLIVMDASSIVNEMEQDSINDIILDYDMASLWYRNIKRALRNIQARYRALRRTGRDGGEIHRDKSWESE